MRLFLLAVALVLAPLTAVAQERPNILWLTSEDLPEKANSDTPHNRRERQENRKREERLPEGNVPGQKRWRVRARSPEARCSGSDVGWLAGERCSPVTASRPTLEE